MGIEVTSIRDDILKAALEDVVFDGWSWEVLCSAGEKAGFSKNEVRAVFPGGMIEVFDHFSDWADREMLAALSDIDPEDLKIRERIRSAVVARFEALQAYKDAVRSSASKLLRPSYKMRVAKMGWRSASVIWDWAGDVSEDYNYYTKRAILSGILASASLVWFNDADEDMHKTKAFLDKRIENVMQFEKFKRSVKEKIFK